MFIGFNVILILERGFNVLIFFSWERIRVLLNLIEWNEVIDILYIKIFNEWR